MTQPEVVTTVIENGYALNTLYFVLCGALVMWMAAGFAMLEAGLVRAKNTTEILTKNIALFAVACTMYMLCGYWIMYGSGDGYIVDFSALLFDGTEPDAATHGGHSKNADFFFQVVFVATAMSIVSGAVAERMKLWAFLAFAVVFCGLIYPIQGYWKWGAGFLDAAGFQDFAGSAVVHMCGAAAALAAVIVLGPRKGKYGPNGEVNPILGANLPLATLGTFILWLGWFGFNGGSQLVMTGADNANVVAAIFVNTNAAAAAGCLGALLVARILFGKADLTMALNGALAGLVAITAGPDSPAAWGAALIGLVGGVIVVFSILMFDKLRLDDPVGAMSVHGVVGVFGVLVVPFTNEKAEIGTQLMGIGVIFAWTFATSLVLWLVLKAVMGIRVTEEEEYNGVDLAECGQEAYPEFTKG